jgi:type IV secretory pathway VirB2 component (pilin)
VSEALQLYVEPLSNPASLLLFWDALTWLTQVWAAFFSPLFLVVSILGVFYLYGAEVTAGRRRLILAWVFVSAIGSVLAAPIGYNPVDPARGESQIWRVLFLTPFQLTAPLGVASVVGFLQTLRTASKDAWSNQGATGLVRSIFLSSLFVVGFALAWGPMQWRLGLILIVLPVLTWRVFAASPGNEKQLLTDVVLLLLLLVAFNYATRCLAQLLIDPHNYRP